MGKYAVYAKGRIEEIVWSPCGRRNNGITPPENIIIMMVTNSKKLLLSLNQKALSPRFIFNVNDKNKARIIIGMLSNIMIGLLLIMI